MAVIPAGRDAAAYEDAPMEELRVAGIAEVCVHPDARRIGHVTAMIGVAHLALERMGFEVAALFGNPEVYRSSGYRIADNLVRFLDDKEAFWTTVRFDGRENGAFLWRRLSRSDWPGGVIDIGGLEF